jgi:mannose-6-phosphate isomerase-like protein (cupin superfamily)
MEPGSIVPKHTHEDAFEFYFVVSGGGTVRRWNHNAEGNVESVESFDISPNSAVKVPPGVAHEWEAGKKGMKGVYFMMKEGVERIRDGELFANYRPDQR